MAHLEKERVVRAACVAIRNLVARRWARGDFCWGFGVLKTINCGVFVFLKSDAFVCSRDLVDPLIELGIERPLRMILEQV